MLMETEGTQWIGHLRKTWWDCVSDTMKSFGMTGENAHGKDYNYDYNYSTNLYSHY